MGIPYAEVIGDPVAHSKSPLIHRFWLEQTGMDGDYRTMRVTAGELADYLAARRGDPDWRGCSVTIPHKQTIMPLLDECRTGFVRAVNCVTREDGRLIGHNTDASGVGAALPRFVDTAHPICLIGAGGAAQAVVGAVDAFAVYQLNVIARDPVKAAGLVSPYGDHGRTFPFAAAQDAIRGCAGLVNATPLGMSGFEPMPAAVLDSLLALRRGAFVLDMVYAPPETDLLRRAADLGFYTGDGLTILVAQAAEAFSFFFGVSPLRSRDGELRELLLR